MEGPGVAPGALGETARGAPGRRRELDVDPARGEADQDRLDQRGLAGAGAAGDHQQLARERGGERGALARREAQRQLAFDAGEARLEISDRPRRPAARERAQTLRDLALGLMDRGQKHARHAIDRVLDQAARGDLHRERSLERVRRDLEQRRGARRSARCGAGRNGPERARPRARGRGRRSGETASPARCRGARPARRRSGSRCRGCRARADTGSC